MNAIIPIGVCLKSVFPVFFIDPPENIYRGIGLPH
jgi:hypothetical protein